MPLTMYQRLDKTYHETFGDYFPNMCFMSASTVELCEMIKKCLRLHKPAKEVFNLNYNHIY